MKGWTEERRRKQAEAIKRHKPWEKSTGPRSAAGKARSSKNARKHGRYDYTTEELREALRLNKRALRALEATLKRQILESRLGNEQIKNTMISKDGPLPPPQTSGTK